MRPLFGYYNSGPLTSGQTHTTQTPARMAGRVFGAPSQARRLALCHAREEASNQ
jgi:hypothetical protein